MVAFLNWAKSIALGALNGVVKVALFVVLVIIVLMIVGIFVVDLARRWWRENEWKRRWKEREKEE